MYAPLFTTDTTEIWALADNLVVTDLPAGCPDGLFSAVIRADGTVRIPLEAA